ncbi:hypothetical protein [Chromobacterium subtsugae]|uniref:hypothetical protein n=1 Tax=Chromobacterium subtsugae TaxID=251747 RepID=UPI000A46149B|nr:hypothetical protein [Chromobacterium subtsugae]
MAYFELENTAELKNYPFDFHSHLNGILPVEGEEYASGQVVVNIDNKDVKIEEKTQLSMLGYVNSKLKHDNSEKNEALKAHISLFCYALEYMASPKNPFLKFTDSNFSYSRGECAAESVYIASLIIVKSLKMFAGQAFYPQDPSKYRGILQAITKYREDSSDLPSFLKTLVPYFNEKIYSANKYTPFDDAYELRGAVTDPLKESRGREWILMSLAYQSATGVTHSQIATSFNSLKDCVRIFEAYNTTKKEKHYLLAHTAHAYARKENFENELNNIRDNYFTSQNNNETVIGLDLVGAENKLAQYEVLFNLLIAQTFQKPNAFEKITLHIHAGEGAGVGLDNRSMLGYFYKNSRASLGDDFYQAFGDYVWKCYCNAVAEAEAKKREDQLWGKTDSKDVSRLFDELFRNNSFNYGGLNGVRYDLTSDATRALVRYNGKRNILALEKVLSMKSNGQYDAKTLKGSYYDALVGVGGNKGFTIRIGHAYYYRNYMIRRFPQLYYDTNLGSNFITGASTMFDDPETYRHNKGLRKLDGYFDTEFMDEACAMVLSDRQLNISQCSSIISAFTKTDEERKKDLENIIKILGLEDSIKVEGFKGGALKFISNVNKKLILNKSEHSYLLGADGQGVEHSDVRREAARMAALITYDEVKSAAGVGDGKIDSSVKVMLETASGTIGKKAIEYWNKTVGDSGMKPDDELAKTGMRIETFQGETDPASVVEIRAKFH